MDKKALTSMEKVDMLIEQYISTDDKSAITTLLNDKGDKFFSAPYSSNKEYYGAKSGGLAEYTLAVVYHLCRLNPQMNAGLEMSSLIKVGLLHEFGKIGYGKEDLFLPQESQWHRDRGMMYVINDKLKGFDPKGRTMLILQDYGIHFNEVEYQAMLEYEGQYSDSNKLTRYRENKLTLLLQWAHIWTITQDKI
tara:strand:- start:1167 stop:1745 length:579 start_codon:yes stop_codon:yes gene_type:complete